MKPTHLMLAGAVALAASFLAPQSAKAQFFGGGGPGLFNQSPYLGHPYGASLYSLGRIPVPPYFLALHPPVYYGRRVRATFGTSPFPQLPYGYNRVPALYGGGGVFTVPVSQQATPSKVVINPHFKGEIKPLEQNKPASPKVVINPYYQREAAGRLARKPRD